MVSNTHHRSDVVHLDFDPSSGKEMKARSNGTVVTLMGAGTDTQKQFIATN